MTRKQKKNRRTASAYENRYNRGEKNIREQNGSGNRSSAHSTGKDYSCGGTKRSGQDNASQSCGRAGGERLRSDSVQWREKHTISADDHGVSEALHDLFYSEEEYRVAAEDQRDRQGGSSGGSGAACGEAGTDLISGQKSGQAVCRRDGKDSACTRVIF